MYRFTVNKTEGGAAKLSAEQGVPVLMKKKFLPPSLPYLMPQQANSQYQASIFIERLRELIHEDSKHVHLPDGHETFCTAPWGTLH